MLPELVEQCQQGNAFAQKRLFDRYANRLFRGSLRYVRSEPEAEEILMNGFLKVFRSIGDLSGIVYHNGLFKVQPEIYMSGFFKSVYPILRLLVSF